MGELACVDADGTVSLLVAGALAKGPPRLVEPYVGFEGEPYAGVEDYRYLRGRYPVRELPA